METVHCNSVQAAAAQAALTAQHGRGISDRRCPGLELPLPQTSPAHCAPVLVVGRGCVLAPSWQRSHADGFLGACDYVLGVSECWMQLTHLCCINIC